MLELDKVTKQFGGLKAVNEMSLTVEAGEIVGLLGPNGSGKSTVMDLVSGAIARTSGEIRLEGKPIGGLPPHKISHLGVARTFQLVRLAPSLSVRDNVVLALAFSPKRLWGLAAAEKADLSLARVGLEGRGDQRIDDLNYIDQKRVELARAISADPKLLLLDEWMAGLNPTELHTAIDLIGRLQDTGITILLVEHIMEAVRALCPRCIVMSAGTKIADGKTAEVLEIPAVREAYLGEAVNV